MDHVFAIKLFGALFAIMNPFVNLPVFLGLTDGAGAAVQRQVALKVGLFSAVMGGIVALAGGQILTLFGISVDDFRVAGGLVLLLISLNMLHGESSSSHNGTEDEQASFPDPASIAFYPLTFPIIVGPGTITTLIVFSGQVTTVTDGVIFGAVFALCLAMLTVVLYFAGFLGGYLSDTARVIMSRLMGMILAAISVDMMAAGLRTLLPGLAG